MTLFDREEEVFKQDYASEFKPYSFVRISSDPDSMTFTGPSETEEPGFHLLDLPDTEQSGDLDDEIHEQKEVMNDHEERPEPIEANEPDKEEQQIDIARIEREAFQKGYEEGEKEALEQSRKRVEPILETFEQALTELAKIKKELCLITEKEAVSLALAVAKKIVCREITLNRDILRNVVKQALSRVVDHEKIKIRLNPSDLEYLKETNFKSLEFLDKTGDITLEEDPSIQAGGCVVETNMGEIDARIEKQIQAVEDAFMLELEKNSAQEEIQG